MFNLILIILVWNVRGDPLCPWGKYGDTCDKNCSKHCRKFPGLDIVHCHRTSGSCSEGCVQGFYDATCNKECGKNCINNTCNQPDGMCTGGCKHGQTGNFCEVSEDINDKKKLGKTIPAVPIILTLAIILCIPPLVFGLRRRKMLRMIRKETWMRTQDVRGLLKRPVADTPLHKSSAGGDLDLVKQIMNDGEIHVNTQGLYGLTPLMLAAQKGHYDVFEYLQSKGADMKQMDLDGDHILSMACVGGNMDIVKYVVLKEPSLINKQRKDGRTALMWAAWHRKKTVFDYLLKEGADSSLVDDDGYNMLHYACFGGDTGMVNDAITTTSIDINTSDIYGRTAVMVAAACGYKDMVDLLFEKKRDMSHIDKTGNNILHVACRGGHVKIVENILSHKDTDINCRGQYGGTPLMMSAFDGHREVFDLLVTKGADATLVCNKGNNILHVACIGGHVEMVKHIMSQGIGDVNSQNQDGTTPLMSIELQRCGETLLIDLSQVNNKRNNVLHLACEIGSMEIVQHVVSQDSLDINAKNSKGETATRVAKRKHHMDLYEWLVSQGGHVVSKSYKH